MLVYAILIVSVVGCVGGLVNALLFDRGLIFPKFDELPGSKGRIWRPGWVGNVVVGCVAALVLWGLYGPFASVDLFASASAVAGPRIPFTLSSVIGALLSGIGGSRILTNEIEKRFLRDSNQSLGEALKEISEKVES